MKFEETKLKTVCAFKKKKEMANKNMKTNQSPRWKKQKKKTAKKSAEPKN